MSFCPKEFVEMLAISHRPPPPRKKCPVCKGTPLIALKYLKINIYGNLSEEDRQEFNNLTAIRFKGMSHRLFCKACGFVDDKAIVKDKKYKREVGIEIVPEVDMKELIKGSSQQNKGG